VGRLKRPTNRGSRVRARAAAHLRGRYVVGAIEILAGIIVAIKPRYGGYVVAAWLGRSYRTSQKYSGAELRLVSVEA
jgi:hypothetical protein